MFEVSEPGRMILEMVLFCKALPLARPRIGIGKHIYQPLENQAAMREEMKPYRGETIDSPFWLSVHAYYGSQNKGDLDNVVKAVADNLTYLGMITDDRLMRGLTASFETGVEDFVVIRLNEVKLAVKRLSI
jgi:Holliday junction resolvase RusA-like endonuclease